MPTNSRCKLGAPCGKWCASCHSPVMVPSGSVGSPIMIIGEAPGQEEDRLGRQFVGPTGRFLRREILSPLDIDDEHVSWDNAMRCFVRSKISRKIVLDCRKNLEISIRHQKPKVIVALGNAPLTSLLFSDKLAGITKWRGKKLWSREFGCWIVPTFHPTGLMRELGANNQYRQPTRFHFEQTLEDFELAANLADKPLPIVKQLPTPKVLAHGEIGQFLSRALLQSAVVVDFETGSLDPRGEILGAAVCYKKGGTYYPAYLIWSDMDVEELNLFEKLMGSRSIMKIFHHAGFDMKYAIVHGIDVHGPIYDTMIAVHKLDENFVNGLKENIWRYEDFGGYDIPLERWKFEHKFTKKSSYSEIDPELLQVYGGLDGYATYRLYEAVEPRLEKEKLGYVTKKISFPIRKVITDAEVTGIHLDVKAAKDLGHRLDNGMRKLERVIYTLAGHRFNIRSNPAMASIVFGDFKVHAVEKTKSGNSYKLDKVLFKKLSVQKKNKKAATFATAVLQYKYLDKLKKTYIEQPLRFVWDDSRIHSNYLSTGTVTDRISNFGPCTHNIPQDRLIRSLYGARPGWYLVEGDLKSAEMVVIAALSKDERLLKIFQEGLDVHDMTFNWMFEKPKENKPNQEQRRVAKGINFGIIYGITAPGLAVRLGILTERAQAFIDRYLATFQGVARWLKNIVKFGTEFGYVRTPFGAKRRLPDLKHDVWQLVSRAQRQAQNAPIQGGAAELAYIGLIRLAALMKKHKLQSRIIHTVHDCGLEECPTLKEAKFVAGLMKLSFEKTVRQIGIPMRIDVHIGRRWGENNESKLDEILKKLKV